MNYGDAVKHLIQYVVEDDSISVLEIYSFARLHTEFDEEDVPELIDRLSESGIEVYDPESAEEEAAVEQIEERERDLVRQNPQIYMQDLARFAVLTRAEELDCARSMNAAMSKVLKTLAPYREVADRALQIFNKLHNENQLSLALNGFLNPVYKLPDPTTKTDDQKRDSEQRFYSQARSRIARYRRANQAYFSDKPSERPAEKLAALEDAFRYFKFATIHYSNLLQVFESTSAELDQYLGEIFEICSQEGLSRQATEEVILTRISEQPISDLIQQLPKPVRPAIKRNIRALEHARNGIQQLEHQQQLSFSQLRERSLLAKEAIQEFKEATNRLVTGNLRLVMKIVQQFTNFDQNMPDLVQEGNLGLMRAAQKFDYTLGFRFSTYASFWIREYVRLKFAEASQTVRLPTKLTNVIQKVNRSRNSLNQRLAREPTIGEIVEDSGLALQAVLDAKRYEAGTVSIDEPVNSEEDGVTFVDTLVSEGVPSPEDLAMQKGLADAFELALSNLTTREAQMVISKYGIWGVRDQSTNELAEQLQIPAHRVRQVVGKAIRKLRFPEYKELLEPYL